MRSGWSVEGATDVWVDSLKKKHKRKRHASEEQFSRFLHYEVDAIRKACASLEEGYLPLVTFIVVQKRHHTLFCPEDHRSHRQPDRRGNILQVTVVDTKICHPSEFDFYLCSHSGIQDELDAKPEELEGEELESKLLEPVAALSVHPVHVPGNKQLACPTSQKVIAKYDELAALQAEMAL
ncbi:hypothetical protein ZEAMMB73_Zm00001d014580 [Zea mays]|uniref:Piwi domain-containing protein n=1 Tax=Zea mays TaxID=4577 RepID=A0A1D6GUC8_MAIZE|nr:hypothetical protein ZEAMMB73_Zm00001d014580 [Zea mays]AQK66580.1 hypothetical protein ZEAMMB73_Zm00001d014580 [Zea mays]